MAASTASAPLLQKKAWPPKDLSESAHAKAPCASVYQVLGTWINCPTCSRTASTTRGGQCPSRLQPQPGKKSRYRLPSASQIDEPSPRTRQTG